MNLWELLTAKLYKWYKGHDGVADAHHVKYTDAEVDAIVATHTAIGDAHHAPYTNADAVTAVLADDAYVKNTGDNMTGNLIFSNINTGIRTLNDAKFLERIVNRVDIGWASRLGASVQCYHRNYAGHEGEFRFIYGGGNYGKCMFLHYDGSTWITAAEFNKDLQLDMYNHIIKDMKNHTHSALSGTKKLIEIDIGGVPYYYEVYPTKA